MRASPSLDAEIARVVFRLIVVYDSSTEEYRIMEDEAHSAPIAPYSSDPYHAQNIVDHYFRQGWTFKYWKDGEGYLAGFSRNDGSTYRMFLAETLPLVICAAALGVAQCTHIQTK